MVLGKRLVIKLVTEKGRAAVTGLEVSMDQKIT
jgi:hypothetical protein